MEPEEIVLISEPETERQRAQDILCGFPAFPVELCRECSEAREHVLWQPDVGLVLVFFTSNFVALLLSTVKLAFKTIQPSSFQITEIPCNQSPSSAAPQWTDRSRPPSPAIPSPGPARNILGGRRVRPDAARASSPPSSNRTASWPTRTPPPGAPVKPGGL